MMDIPIQILVVDDEEVMRDSCSEILSEITEAIRTAEDGEKALEFMKNHFFDVVILDLKMAGFSGMEVLHWIQKHNPESVVVVITGYATVESAVEALKAGAYDFLPKPFTPEELRIIVNRALEKRKHVSQELYLKQTLNDFLDDHPLIGQSKAIQKIHDLVNKVGPTGSTVLITGESGTGKELVARAIHAQSVRKNKPFITVDCSTLVENLFESELFGHVKGSFTGATVTKHGRLELANGGTIFFDEISNIGINIQAKLLRALQEREITKVGSTQAVKIDIRIIAATNIDLLQAVKMGTFREDLFYRLGVVPVELPPLRERKDDIPFLTHHFIDKYNKKRRKSVKGITDLAMKMLTEYSWPGNVRELENTIERAVVLTENERIQKKDLYIYQKDEAVEIDQIKTLEDVEKRHIQQMLGFFNGQRGMTAEALGIDRKTLRIKMRKYGISEDYNYKNKES